MVKKYDYNTDPSITVLLSVEGGTHEEIERCFSIARSVCERLEGKNIRYDFLTNATSAGAIGIWNNVAEGLGSSHLMTILEGLGRATYDCTERMSDTLNRAYRRSDQGRSHIVIVPNKTDELLDICQRFKKVKGGKMLVLSSEEVGEC